MKRKFVTMILMLLVASFGLVLAGAPSTAGQTDTDGDGVPDVGDNCPTVPNPEKIAFYSLRDGNYEIYVMNPDGSNPTNLTNNPAHDLGPSFSPDGSRIIFTSFRSGNREIFVMNADGSNPLRLTDNPADDFSPSWGAQADSDGDGTGDACDNAAPVARCRNVTVTLDPGMTTAGADINDGSFDPDGDPLTFTYNPSGPYQVGSTPVTLTVDDGNGGSDSCAATVTVFYRFSFFDFSGLLSNAHYLIEAKAGGDVPVRFSLSGFKGDNPYNSPPVSQRINCLDKNPTGQIQQIQTGIEAASYNATFDFYQTTWRTQANWAGTCRRLTLFLKDGTTQSLDFRFN